MLCNADAVAAFADGRNGRSGHIFHDGNVLYSYGYHHPLAFRHPEGDWGCDVKYLINEDRSSVSTARHRSACHYLAPSLSISVKEFEARHLLSALETGKLEIIKLRRYNTMRQGRKYNHEIPHTIAAFEYNGRYILQHDRALTDGLNWSDISQAFNEIRSFRGTILSAPCTFQRI